MDEKQRERIAESTAKHLRDSGRLNKEFRGKLDKDREVEFVKKLHELNVEREAKSFDTLTQAQKEKYQTLVGKPFDLGQMKSAPAEKP